MPAFCEAKEERGLQGTRAAQRKLRYVAARMGKRNTHIESGIELLVCEPSAPMKARGLISLAIIMVMASCTAGLEPPAIAPTLPPPAGIPVTTQAASPTPVPASTASEPAPTASTGSFELIGHSPLLNRGMNAGLAIYGNYEYVGSRTDGSHPDAGVLVVELSNPADPQIVYQIGPPEQAIVGQTSRELRVWPDQELLLVLNFDCDPGLHDCRRSLTPPRLSFYDISGANAAAPQLIAVHTLARTPHEMFLWDDPGIEGRALLYLSTPARSGDNLLVIDISQARQGLFQEAGSWSAPAGTFRGELHSLSLSVDGRRAYLAHLRDGFMILDTSDLADGIADPQIRLLTPVESWALWSSPGPHSAVRLFGKPFALITEEVYGSCPWGWTHIIDITDEARPQFAAEYRLHPYNTVEHCAGAAPERYRSTSFSAHNPTVTKNLALITWHSGGLQAVSIADPLGPVQVAQFLPEPLPSVGTEDPALSSGPDKVVMWSYPIIRDGLIYVVDVRNGLYILKYHGPFEQEVNAIRFLEGNSNLGEAQLWATP